MKVASLSGSSRESVGKKDAKDLRKEGRIPAVLYGGDNQVHLHLPEIALEKLVYNPDVFKIELDVDGTVYNCIIRELQFHPVTDKILHVDLLQMFDDREIWVDIPVRTEGNSVGVRNGGRLAVNHRRLRLIGTPGSIPEYVMVDISNLDIGDVIRVREMNIEGARIAQADSDVVVGVKRTRAAMSAASSEEAEGEAAEEGAEEAAAE
ncbi:50S ribosomal protein L25/general stress protein Ctc [Sanyastnella coralliicola]|uniref:50S ribosomal protein L25/general stress protein Ctc n=1 Tax=Sanyastnella coralliicola TaxID=3069118 RepID=UPI0027B941BD|nr:50S ribosomal protein L25/general stress protein Ctc [Longitalea sp. SCSIO 12813]